MICIGHINQFCPLYPVPSHCHSTSASQSTLLYPPPPHPCLPLLLSTNPVLSVLWWQLNWFMFTHFSLLLYSIPIQVHSWPSTLYLQGCRGNQRDTQPPPRWAILHSADCPQTICSGQPLSFTSNHNLRAFRALLAADLLVKTNSSVNWWIIQCVSKPEPLPGPTTSNWQSICTCGTLSQPLPPEFRTLTSNFCPLPRYSAHCCTVVSFRGFYCFLTHLAYGIEY